ncbi:MAG TPA: ATP-binding protein [Deferrisomatales bacterium]|nr:ATP-binding protein [Deferrisomatales bacterium]
MSEARLSENELRQAMSLFEASTASLRDSYGRLQIEVAEMRRQLELKDRELGASRAERDRLAGYLEHLLESVPSGVVAVDPAGRITTLNRAAQEITGLDAAAVGARFQEAFPLLPRGDEPAPTLAGLEHQPRPVVRFLGSDGQTAELGLRVSPFLGDGGEVLGRVVVFQDVTRLRRLEAQESRNRRLVSMGEMAAGIAHEIRNPLGSLELFASHLLEELRGSSNEDLAGQVLKGIQNLSRISGNLLLFARKVEPRREPVDLTSVLEEALLYARAALNGKGLALEQQWVSTPVLADADLLRQVFLNLLLNAVQASPEGGVVQVRVEVDPEESPPVAVVHIADQGAGVAPDIAERIFDPFFTTRAGGMGLGLAIVQRIVSGHGGWVAVGPGPLGGADFTVGLPVAGCGKVG